MNGGVIIILQNPVLKFLRNFQVKMSKGPFQCSNQKKSNTGESEKNAKHLSHMRFVRNIMTGFDPVKKK